MKISNVRTQTHLIHGNVGDGPVCCMCVQMLPESGLPRCTPQRDGSIGTTFEGASCTMSYRGYERHALLCPACHAEILAREAAKAQEGQCYCSRCGAERDAFAWDSGRYSPAGLCMACFQGRVNDLCAVIGEQVGPALTLLAVATGDFEIDPAHPERRPTRAVQERSWRLLDGRARRVRR